jgi:hypothetical protein
MRNMEIVDSKPKITEKLITMNRTLLTFAAAAALILGAGQTTKAALVDLTGAGSSGQIGDALFFESDQQPAGTGFIQSFLRVQASPTEQGYNTDGGFPFDDKNPHNFQHSLLLSSLSTFTLNGTAYFKFMLDANQSSHEFSLTQLQFYTGNDGSQTTTTINPDGTLPLGHLAYNLNPGGGTANSVLTHATGSGKFDAIVYVPVSDFNLSDKYVTLYFAGVGNGGFEEWTAATGVAPVPEVTPASVIIGFLGLLVAVSSRRMLARRMRPAGVRAGK